MTWSVSSKKRIADKHEYVRGVERHLGDPQIYFVKTETDSGGNTLPAMRVPEDVDKIIIRPRWLEHYERCVAVPFKERTVTKLLVGVLDGRDVQYIGSDGNSGPGTTRLQQYFFNNGKPAEARLGRHNIPQWPDELDTDWSIGYVVNKGSIPFFAELGAQLPDVAENIGECLRLMEVHFYRTREQPL
jgi:hypothetical protein